MKIALAGNPNSGKTTMFNDLTGSSQYVGNWPGVTVEKKEGRLRGQKDIVIQDLPGIYSLSPYTPEEVVTRNYLINDKPDVIIDIVDASNIQRNLYLTTQLIETGIPVVIALNMIDIVKKRGDKIDTQALAFATGCAVIETSALKGDGSKEAVEKAIAAAQSKTTVPQPIFEKDVEAVLHQIGSLTQTSRWIAIKLFERDSVVYNELALSPELEQQLENIITSFEKQREDDSESIIADQRYIYIAKIARQCIKLKNASNMSASDKIDLIVTNRWLALPIFALIIFTMYFISVSTIGAWMTGWANVFFSEWLPDTLQGVLLNIGSAPILNSLILDGIIAGVGAVLGFLPQMLMLFLCLAILEDCGYMARIAFIMDRIFRKFGLSGKSLIPILIGTGCGVPGVMASRTIENESDRRMTVITTTFIPCGAKLPVIALIASSLFPGTIWVAPSAYFIGIMAILFSGVMLKRTKAFKSNQAPFVMELPSYHVPSIRNLILHTMDRCKSFVKKAGTVILVASVAIWFLRSFNWQLQQVGAENAILASLGRMIAPIFRPLGWGNWQSAVATISGLIAKENVVGSLGVMYGISGDAAGIAAQMATHFTPLAGYSFLIFNLLCAPCVAAIGAIWREMRSIKWGCFALGYQTGLAYLVSFLVYQSGMFLSGGGVGMGTLAVGVIVVAIVGGAIISIWKNKKNGGCASGCAGCSLSNDCKAENR